MPLLVLALPLLLCSAVIDGPRAAEGPKGDETGEAEEKRTQTRSRATASGETILPFGSARSCPGPGLLGCELSIKPNHAGVCHRQRYRRSFIDRAIPFAVETPFPFPLMVRETVTFHSLLRHR
jgi:hypothetical protein